MTTEEAIKYGKAYKLYFSTDTYDFVKYRGEIRTGALLQQRDRALYYRLSRKLNDAQIHATLLHTYFYKPHAYIADVLTPEATAAGIALASRAELGERRLAMDLYDLRKRVTSRAMNAWLYAQLVDGDRAAIPGCIEDLMAHSLPLDLACLLLLIPQSTQNWSVYWQEREPQGTSFGVRPWLSRLQKADQILYLYRPQWRQLSHKLSRLFWESYRSEVLLPPVTEISTSLFT